MAEYIEDECLEEIEGFMKVLDGFTADGRDIYVGAPAVGGLGIIDAAQLFPKVNLEDPIVNLGAVFTILILELPYI